ncbi:hypothetical protein FO519_001535 [Halicephalobus sp. NKZ332]|nr:hypothetical protein FO519_001535 [Halicephalobus sp. NKZ332]
MSWNNRSPESNASSSSPSSNGHRYGRHSIHVLTSPQLKVPPRLIIKSKFDSEFRRFSFDLNQERVILFAEFRSRIEDLHSLHNIPFTLCYTSNMGDLLPITNDERKGESWEEKYGYGTDTIDRKKKGLSAFLPTAQSKPPRRNYNISNPEDFRQVSAIIDVDIVPETHRRVRLCKYGGEDKKLGFYIRDGTSVRLTPQGAEKVAGIFISRLLGGGLAESSGLLAVNDEVIEVNGISVQGKTLDQVTDMMIANAQNLIITTKPANQRNTLERGGHPRNSGTDSMGSVNRRSVGSASSGGPHSVRNAIRNPPPPVHRYDQSDSEEDEVVEYFDGGPIRS